MSNNERVPFGNPDRGTMQPAKSERGESAPRAALSERAGKVVAL
jgi:hypothetical protein